MAESGPGAAEEVANCLRTRWRHAIVSEAVRTPKPADAQQCHSDSGASVAHSHTHVQVPAPSDATHCCEWLLACAHTDAGPFGCLTPAERASLGWGTEGRSECTCRGISEQVITGTEATDLAWVLPSGAPEEASGEHVVVASEGDDVAQGKREGTSLSRTTPAAQLDSSADNEGGCHEVVSNGPKGDHTVAVTSSASRDADEPASSASQEDGDADGVTITPRLLKELASVPLSEEALLETVKLLKETPCPGTVCQSLHTHASQSTTVLSIVSCVVSPQHHGRSYVTVRVMCAGNCSRKGRASGWHRQLQRISFSPRSSLWCLRASFRLSLTRATLWVTETRSNSSRLPATASCVMP